MSTADEGPKPLVWLAGEIKTPPFSVEARIEAGELLRRLQDGELLRMPHSRPMPSIGPRRHEPPRTRPWGRLADRLPDRSRCDRHRRGLRQEDAANSPIDPGDLPAPARPLRHNSP